MLYFKSAHPHLRHDLLYVDYFVYEVPDDGILEAETCIRGIVKWLIIDLQLCSKQSPVQTIPSLTNMYHSPPHVPSMYITPDNF